MAILVASHPAAAIPINPVDGGGPTIIDITGSLRVGTASLVGPATGVPLPGIDIGGKTNRVSQSGVVRAVVSAPNAEATHGRDSRMEGCECTSKSKTDKHTTWICVQQ